MEHHNLRLSVYDIGPSTTSVVCSLNTKVELLDFDIKTLCIGKTTNLNLIL